MNLIFSMVFVIFATLTDGKYISYSIARIMSPAAQLKEEIPLYTPYLKRFATLYVFKSDSDTICVITGDNTRSLPVYEFGRGIYRFMLFNGRMWNYKNTELVYAGYSTFFVKDGNDFYDTRYFLRVKKDYVQNTFRRWIKFKDYADRWKKYKKYGAKLDEHMEIDKVPAYLWSYGCSPTASAMILGYWDKRGYGRLIDYYFNHYDVVLSQVVSNVPNVQRELAVYMNADTTTGYTDWAPISTGTQDCANLENGYSFISQWVYDTIVYDTACSYDTAYMYLKAEIDSGRPVHWAVGNYLDPYGRIIEHSTCAIGYQVSGEDTFVILHNTWDYGTWAWPLYTSDSTYIALYNVVPYGSEQGNVQNISSFEYIVNNLTTPLFIRYDDTLVVAKSELYYTQDNADSWIFLGYIPRDTQILFKKSFDTTDNLRFMVRTYDDQNELISSESSLYPVSVIQPGFEDGIFNSKAYTVIQREPKTINRIDSIYFIGTSYGHVEVKDNDSILNATGAVGNHVFSSAQQGNYIIYGEYAGGFSIYHADSMVYSDSTRGYVVDVAIEDTLSAVFERNYGIRVIHYKNGYKQDTINAGEMYYMTGALDDSLLYIGTLRHGFLVYNLLTREYVDTVGQGRVFDMCISKHNNLLYVLFSGYLKVYNVSEPTIPLLSDSVQVSSATLLRCNKNSAYVIEGTKGLEIYTFTNTGYFRSAVRNVGTLADVCAEDSLIALITKEGLVLTIAYGGSQVKEPRYLSTGLRFIINGNSLNLGEKFNGETFRIYSITGRMLEKEHVQNGNLYFGGIGRGIYILKSKTRILKAIKIN